MYVKFPPRDLNPSPYPSHFTSTYTCGVTIALRVYGDIFFFFLMRKHHFGSYILGSQSIWSLHFGNRKFGSCYF